MTFILQSKAVSMASIEYSVLHSYVPCKSLHPFGFIRGKKKKKKIENGPLFYSLSTEQNSEFIYTHLTR